MPALRDGSTGFSALPVLIVSSCRVAMIPTALGAVMSIRIVVALLALGLAASASATPRIPPIPLRMIFERGADGNVVTLNVQVINATDQPVCISRDYAAPARVVLTHEPAVRTPALGGDAPAQPGCLDLAPGASVSAAFDLKALFPDEDLSTPRACYSLPMRSGQASDGDAELGGFWVACTQARR